MIEKQIYDNCETCARHNNEHKDCENCDGESEFFELYNADPQCKHEIFSDWNGVHCSKCNAWFCY